MSLGDTLRQLQASELGHLASLMLSEGHKETEEWSRLGTMGDLVALQMGATV